MILVVLLQNRNFALVKYKKEAHIITVTDVKSH